MSIKSKVEFYGLDLYSLNTSMQAVIQYLKKVDAVAAEHIEGDFAAGIGDLHVDFAAGVAGQMGEHASGFLARLIFFADSVFAVAVAVKTGVVLDKAVLVK